MRRCSRSMGGCELIFHIAKHSVKKTYRRFSGLSRTICQILVLSPAPPGPHHGMAEPALDILSRLAYTFVMMFHHREHQHLIGSRPARTPRPRQRQGCALDDVGGHDGILCVTAPTFNRHLQAFAPPGISLQRVRATGKVLRSMVRKTPKIAVRRSLDLGVSDICRFTAH